MNVLVAGRPQILDEADWVERLHLRRRDVGTSMDEIEVDDFSRQVDLTSVRAFRVAVGRRTREVVSSLPAATWREPIDPIPVQQLLAAGAFAEAALDKASATWVKRRSRDIPLRKEQPPFLTGGIVVRLCRRSITPGSCRGSCESLRDAE